MKKLNAVIACFVTAMILVGMSVSGAVLPEISSNEKALQGTVIIDTRSSVIMVNGAKRYIDFNDIEKKPIIMNGITYLPVHSLARALGYYYESIPQKGYYLLRNNNTEIRFDSQYTYIKDETGKENIIENKMIYKNGEALMPIRFLAEMSGKKVAYDNGIIVISRENPDSRIIHNSEVRSYIDMELCVFKGSAVSGRTYYVAQTENADDSNEGTEKRPLRTLKRASELAMAGDTVIVREGVYRETLKPLNNGEAMSPIIYRAYDNENVIISAAEIINSFSVDSKGMLKAELPKDLGIGRNQIFYNGLALAEGRYPNEPQIQMSDDGEELSSLFPTRGDFKASPGNEYTIESSTLLRQSVGTWNGAIYVGMQGLGWTLSTGIVKKSEVGKLTVYDTPKQWWFDGSTSDKQSYGFLTGHIRCVDLPGEWAVQNGNLYIIPPNGETANSLELEAKTRQLTVDLSDKRYIHLKNIKTFGGGINMNNSTMCIANGCEMKYISHYIHGHDQREGYIDDGNVKNKNGAPPRGEMGIYISGENNAIINSVIDHSAAAGIYSTGTYAYIENNVIKNCGYAGSYVSGITFGTEGWKSQTTPRGGFSVYNNTVYNCGRSALNMQGRQVWESDSDTPYLPFEVAYNDFHDGILFSLDTGIVYEYFIHAGDGVNNSSFHNNYVYYTPKTSNPYSFGVYHDGNTSGIDTYNNIVFTTQDNVRFTYANIYKQPQAMCNVWNNSQIRTAVKDGRKGLTLHDFPDLNPYFAGSYKKTEDYADYKSKFIANDLTADYYKAEGAVKNKAYSDSNGLVTIERNGWICWENVDFKDGGNNINIRFKGDLSKAGDRISLIIGDSLEKGKKYNAVLKSGAPSVTDIDMLGVSISEFSGVQKVYLRSDLYVSAKIDGISVAKRGALMDSHDASAVYGGEFDNVEALGNNAYVPTPIYYAVGDTIHPMVRNTYGGTILRYDNVKFTDTASKLKIILSTDSANSGQTIKVRIGSIDSEPVAIYLTAGDGWDNYLEGCVDLTKPISEGTYDIYVSFEGNSKTCNLYSFGFIN